MSRYADLYAPDKCQGPGDARPTAMQIVRDEQREGAFAGKVAVVTGVSSGIGPPTVEAMAATGATVLCTARNVAKAKEALGPELLATGRVHVVYMDNTDLATVKAAADEIRSKTDSLTWLINNAGCMAVAKREQTKDGFEMQLGTNHLAHFYLFCLLRDLLEAGSTPAFASRVVNVSSAAHRLAGPDMDDLQLAGEGAYSPWRAYGASKRANVFMANELDRRYGHRATGAVRGFSLMPGVIVTPLQRHLDGSMDALLSEPATARCVRDERQGAATTIFGAVARELEGQGGLYLENAAVADEAPPASVGAMLDMSYGYAPGAFDPELEGKLWAASLKAVGLPDDY